MTSMAMVKQAVKKKKNPSKPENEMKDQGEDSELNESGDEN